jgi:hypothetical protein
MKAFCLTSNKKLLMELKLSVSTAQKMKQSEMYRNGSSALRKNIDDMASMSQELLKLQSIPVDQRTEVHVERIKEIGTRYKEVWKEYKENGGKTFYAK